MADCLTLFFVSLKVFVCSDFLPSFSALSTSFGMSVLMVFKSLISVSSVASPSPLDSSVVDSTQGNDINSQKLILDVKVSHLAYSLLTLFPILVYGPDNNELKLFP